MFSKSIRRPYITCQSELELYNKQKNYICPIKEELALDYKKLKEQHKRFILRDQNCFELTFYEISLWICNDSLSAIANEGVHYLMLFISLGILSVEFNETVDFIKMELNHILESNLLETLKKRINQESYREIRQDLSAILNHNPGEDGQSGTVL